MKNKGYALSAIVYPLLLVCLVLILSILFNLNSKKNLLDNLKNTIKEEYNEVQLLCKYSVGQTWIFDYTGGEQEFIIPCNGNYKIELWGASGQANDYTIENSVGLGAYVSGNISLFQTNKLYLYVGANNYNGGSIGETSGGGATDIRLVNGDWDNFESLKSRIIVAAGGGGGMYYQHSTLKQAGHGGGLIGYDADDLVANHEYTTGYSGHGGTQTSGGTTGIYGYEKYTYSEIMNGIFGIGGYDPNGSSSGGGGGYYGGGHGRHPGGTWTGGGGGSSFISGHLGCDAISKDSTEDNIIHTGQANHYSGYVFTDTKMIDGAGYNWTSEKGEYVGMPTHDGNSTMTGNSGNGYARITLVSIDS